MENEPKGLADLQISLLRAFQDNGIEVFIHVDMATRTVDVSLQKRMGRHFIELEHPLSLEAQQDLVKNIEAVKAMFKHVYIRENKN